MHHSRNYLLLTLLTLSACSSSEPTYSDSLAIDGSNEAQQTDSESQDTGQEVSDAMTVRAQRNALMASTRVELGNDAFERVISKEPRLITLQHRCSTQVTFKHATVHAVHKLL